MDAEGIYEIQEEQEENINTNRVVTFERLTTEYEGDDEVFDFEIINTEINRYLEISSAFLMAFVLLKIAEFSNTDLIISLSPLLLLDFKSILLSLIQVCSNQPSSDSRLSKQNPVKILVRAIGSFIFYILIIIYYFIRPFNLTFTTIPLALSCFIESILKIPNQNQCQLFSTIFLNITSWIKVIAIFSIGLKIDNLIEIEWAAALWPLWMTMTCAAILSSGSLLLLLVSSCSYYYKESPVSEIYSSIWLTYCCSIGCITLGMSGYDLLNMNKSRFPLWPIGYLSIFIILTKLLKSHLLKWWRSLFTNIEQYSIPSSMSNNSPLPLPPSQVPHIRFSTKVVQAIKLPPRKLIRMSSSYFQPVVKQRVMITRAMSEDVKDILDKEFSAKINPHYRSSSAVNKENSNNAMKSIENSFVDKKCSLCCEKECDSVIMDCGHGGICMDCAKMLLGGNRQCHMCRSYITQVLKIKVESSKFLNVIGSNTNYEH